MADPKLPRKLAEKASAPTTQGVAGQASSAAKNREREARVGIIQAFGSLGIPFNQWPDFVRAFSTDPRQQIEYSQSMTPAPFQAPEFDRLNQSPRDWGRLPTERGSYIGIDFCRSAKIGSAKVWTRRSA